MTRTQIIKSILVVACIVGLALIWNHWRAGEQSVPQPPQQVPTQQLAAPKPADDVPKVAPKETAAPANTPPAQRAETPSAKARTLEFHKTKDLKRLFDKYSGPEYEADGRAKYLQARALIVCGPFLESSPDKVAEKLFSKHDKSLPQVQARLNAISVQGKECAAFAGTAKLSDARKLLEQAAKLGDLPALSKQLLDLNDAGKKAEAESLARQILMNPSAEAIEGLTTYFAYRGTAWTVGSDSTEYSKDILMDAWKSASCTWEDSDCGADSRALREICWTQGACQFASFDDYLSRSKYSRSDYETVAGLRQKILNAILARNWRVLGLQN